MSQFLQLGVQAHRAGDLHRARNYYSKQLEVQPKDANAMQLLGLVSSALGDLPQAINLIQASLSINPNQPHVSNNLGICLKKAGQFAAAEKAFQQAISLKADYLEPYCKLISLLLDRAGLEEAARWLEQALGTFTEHPSLLALKADLLQAREEYEAAEQLYQSLLVQNPETDHLRHNLAVTQRLAGNSQAAVENYQYLVAKGMRNYQLLHNLANALSDLGQLKDAVSYYQQAVALNPGYAEAHINLSDLLWELGEREHFLDSYLVAFASEPDNWQLRRDYAQVLLRLSNYQQCYQFLSGLPDLMQQSAQYHQLLGRALKGLGRLDEAANIQHLAVQSSPDSVEFRISLAETLIEASKFEPAQQQLQRAIEIQPDNRLAWGLLGVCWRLVGDERESLLNDYENLVRVYEIRTPPGFESVESFCQALNEYLDTQHTADKQPLHQTLQGGTQTKGNLFNDPHPLVQALVNEFRYCIDDYIEKTVPYAGKIAAVSCSDEYEFSGSWSVRLRQQGFHTPHIHPMGWLSSAFYVQLPQTVNEAQGKQGWFKLGEPNLKLDAPLKAQKFIQPKVGTLVLFQSYMWHGTEPFLSDEQRTTVAFDVVQKNS